MTTDEIPKDVLTDAIYNAVNYGMDFDSVEHADQFIRVHMNEMAKEKAAGYPKGQVIWDGYMRLLKEAIRKKDLMEAKEAHNDILWVPYEIK